MSIAIRSSIGLTTARNSKKDLKKNIENNNHQNHRITSAVLDLAPLEEYVSDKYSSLYDGFFSLLTQTEETPDTEDPWVVRLNHLRFLPNNHSDEWVEVESELYDPSVYHKEMAEIERLRKEEEEAIRRKEEERLRLEEEERQKVVAEKLRQFKQKREEFIRAEQIRRRKRTDSFKKRQREVDDRVEAWIQRKKAGIKESPREMQSLDGDDLMENMSILQLMEQRKRTQPTATKSRDKNIVTVRDDNTDKVIEDQVRQQKIAKESEVDNEEENRLLREEEDRIRKEHEQEVRARREQEQTKRRSDRVSIFQIIETEQERKQRIQNEIAELHSRIASGDVPYTVELLRTNHPHLKKLDLQSREVPLEDFQLIGEALATNKVVQELDLSLNTTFNDDYLPTLCHIVKHNRAIKRLYLEETEIMNHESLLVTLEEYNAIILDLTLSPFATPEERDQLDELLARNESELR